MTNEREVALLQLEDAVTTLYEVRLKSFSWDEPALQALNEVFCKLGLCKATLLAEHGNGKFLAAMRKVMKEGEAPRR